MPQSSDFNIIDVRVVIADTNPEFRHDLSELLQSRSMRVGKTYAVLKEAIHEVEENKVDLLIVNTGLSFGGVTELIRDIRYKKTGDNPFIAIIAITNDMMPNSAKVLLNAGPDAIINMPTPPEYVLDRILHISQSRKSFVASLDYIGPDRRKKIRAEEDQVPLIKVPNPFVAGGFSCRDQKSLTKSIKASLLLLDEQRLENTSRRMVFLTKKISQGMNGTEFVDELPANIDALLFAANDMCARLKGTQYAFSLEKALTMVAMLNDLQKSGAHDDTQLGDLLFKLSTVIKREFFAEAFEASVEQRKIDYIIDN